MSRRPDPRRGWWEAVLTLVRSPLRFARLVPETFGPLELHLLGRTIGSAAAVGLGAGLVGAAFVRATDLAQALLLNGLAGVSLTHAAGEVAGVTSGPERPWLLALLPAAGALVAGLVAHLSPEVAGGGGDATIAAFHAGGSARLRSLPAKLIASVFTLGSGGAGGREGPAMQLGSTVGALTSALLPLEARERRILFVAGMAAGMSAVFRTPLGAALLAAEVLYRDDFESDAIVPSIIASVVGYATGEALLGQRPLFGALPPHPFQAEHLLFYAGLAIVAALAGALFVGALSLVRTAASASQLPVWLKPTLGGAALGLVVVSLASLGAQRFLGVPVASGALGGGYGLAQLAVKPIASGWTAAGVLSALAVLRIGATALTIGTGASAGDFAPSLVIGGLVGGAYGHAMLALFPGSGILPGSFALVGMGALYGGIAHAPVSAVVLVSELTGSYDLLVPLMLAAGGAHVALRRVGLYHAQAAGKPAPAAPAPALPVC